MRQAANHKLPHNDADQSGTSPVDDVINMADSDGWTIAHLAAIRETKVINSHHIEPYFLENLTHKVTKQLNFLSLKMFKDELFFNLEMIM